MTKGSNPLCVHSIRSQLFNVTSHLMRFKIKNDVTTGVQYNKISEKFDSTSGSTHNQAMKALVHESNYVQSLSYIPIILHETHRSAIIDTQWDLNSNIMQATLPNDTSSYLGNRDGCEKPYGYAMNHVMCHGPMCHGPCGCAMDHMDVPWTMWMCHGPCGCAMDHVDVPWTMWMCHGPCGCAMDHVDKPWTMWMCPGHTSTDV
ncbi:hypothetical protein EMCRGX_G020199 [Ephydatia muelleri]